MTVLLTRGQYDALIAAGLGGNAAEIKRLRALIDADNDIVRYRLSIRWQDVGGKAPPRIELGKGWPQDQTFLLEQDRPIAREDVDTVLLNNAVNPVTVMVTPDPDGEVGWTLLEDYTF